MKKLATGLIALSFGGMFGADQVINPYANKVNHYELEIKGDLQQGERVEISKDKAEMTLKVWNDEEAITIKPQLNGGDIVKQADRPMFSDKIEFKDGEATAFIEPKSDTDFDIDFTLDKKPNTNVFEYVITGAENFDFFYQPALTQEEIDEGVSRPENVVGSYAVYHKTKANHRVGSTNYATGKVMHIYRPKAIDTNGKEEWADLNYQNGVLSVTVSQKFLDDAVYPVRVDPTFGYTTGGGSSQTIVNVQAGSKFSLTEAGTTESISVYTVSENDGSNNYAWGIFDGSDNSFIADTGNQTSDPVNNTFKTISIVQVLTAGDYILMAFSSDTIHTIGYDDDAGVERWADAATYPTWEDPIAVAGTTGKTSIYATYTASASATVAENATSTVRDGTVIIRDGSEVIRN